MRGSRNVYGTAAREHVRSHCHTLGLGTRYVDLLCSGVHVGAKELECGDNIPSTMKSRPNHSKHPGLLSMRSCTLCMHICDMCMICARAHKHTREFGDYLGRRLDQGEHELVLGD